MSKKTPIPDHVLFQVWRPVLPIELQHHNEPFWRARSGRGDWAGCAAAISAPSGYRSSISSAARQMSISSIPALSEWGRLGRNYRPLGLE
jgi:hypothetical protein